VAEPVDLAVLAQLTEDVGDDRDLVRNVLATWLEHYPSRRAALGEALAAEDCPAVVAAAHALASASVTVGVVGVSVPARAIEHSAQDGTLVGSAERLAQIDGVLDAVRRIIAQW
jgi:HPt (histidine-containing phosphotransfer) domain-containing protein